MKAIIRTTILLFLIVHNAVGSENNVDRPISVSFELPTLDLRPVVMKDREIAPLLHGRRTWTIPSKLAAKEIGTLTVLRNPREELYDWHFGPRRLHQNIAEYIFNNGLPAELVQNFPFLSKLTNEGLTKSNDFLDKMGSEGKVLTTLTGIQKAKFPVAIKKEIGGVEVLIGIESIEFSNSIAIMKNFFVRLQYTSYSLVFGAPEVKFSRTGGFIEAKLGLIGDIPIPINGDEKSLLIFQGYDYVAKDGCYITVGCDGVQSGSMSASVFVSDKLIYPVNNTGERENGYVHGKIGFTMEDLNDFRGIVSFNKRFKIIGIDKVSFGLSDAIFDGSEQSNDPMVNFPLGYLSEKGNDALDPENWQGLYIDELSVKVDYEDVDIREEIGAEIHGLIIDRFGVTGNFSAVNLLTFDKGHIGNINISVDTLSFGVEKSQLRELRCSGRVGIPAISSENNMDANLAYTATAQGALWSFSAAVIEEVEFPFPLTESKVILERGTTLQIGKDEISNQTLVQVNLCGRADLSKVLPNNDPDQDKKMNAVYFENFVVQSTSPVVKEIGFWSIPGQLALPLGPIRITLEEVIAGKTQEGETLLHFTAGASFSDSDAFSISAKVGINVFGNYDDEEKVLKYDRTKVDRVELCIAAKSWGARVGLDWFEEDPIYGNGFKGIAAVGFESMGYEQSDDCSINAGIFASALFGNLDTTRFYNFELLYINLEKGIPLGPLALHGIGGAISNHMKITGLDDFRFDQEGLEDGAEKLRSQEHMNSPMAKDYLGESLLGVHYRPSADEGFNLRLMTIAASNGSSTIINMRATLAFRFNTHGGLDSISLDVNGQMFMEMTLTKALAIEIPARFEAKVLYDNVNKIFSLNAEVDINVQGQILGGGHITFYVDEQDWYLHIGKPGEAGEIGLLIPAIGVKSNAYFCAGNSNVPDMPLLPKEIRNTFSNAGNSKRNFEVSNDLAGLAFGAHFALGAPAEKNFLLFYYKLHVLVGFDVNIRNYESYLCSGVENFGLRKWYAKGQVYSYIDGAIGIRSGGRKFPIMELKTAFKIYLEAPRPTYGEFAVMVKYKVLGGLIKGRAKVEATFGEQCEFEKGKIDINVFSDIIEPNNPEALGVTQNMTFSGGVPFEQMFSEDDLGESLLKVALRDVNEGSQQGFSSTASTGYAYYISNGETIAVPCAKTYSEDHTFVTYSPEELWPPNAEVWMHPRAEYSQSSNGGSSWKIVPDQDGAREQDTVYRFWTGDYPDHIPVGNISWTYPVNGMSNFYPKEMKEHGFIQLHKSMSYLFENGDSKAEVICHTDPTMSFEVPLSFEKETKRIVWDLPADQLLREGIYTINFRSSETILADPIHFRCSSFDALSIKLEQFRANSGSIFVDPLNAVHREMHIEKFDELELHGNGNIPPLLKIGYTEKTLLDEFGGIGNKTLDIEKNLYISTELQYFSSFNERPKIIVKTPDQLGERPYYEEVQVASQYFHFGVHLEYIDLRQAILDNLPPAEVKDPHPLKEIFVHPEKLPITWTYSIMNEIKSVVRMDFNTSAYDMY